MTFLDDLIDRLLALCEEAVPVTEGFNYLTATYPNFPYWAVGETNVSMEPYGSERIVTVEVLARLYLGKAQADNPGEVEISARTHVPALLDFFDDRAHPQRAGLVSAAYPTPMADLMDMDDLLRTVNKRIVGDTPQYFVIELNFRVRLLRPTAES